MNLSLAGALLSGGSMIDLDGSLVLTLLLFFALLFALQRLVFRPMVALFDARESAIDGAKKEARELEAEADEKLRTFETEMKKAMVGATTERDALRQDGAKLERELLARARAEADKAVEEATAQMETEAAKVRAEMKTSIPALAGSIAEKLLGRRAA